MNIEELFIEIESLPEKDFIRLRRWFAESDWGRWDEQFESDVVEGKLDFLVNEAIVARDSEQLQDL